MRPNRYANAPATFGVRPAPATGAAAGIGAGIEPGIAPGIAPGAALDAATPWLAPHVVQAGLPSGKLAPQVWQKLMVFSPSQFYGRGSPVRPCRLGKQCTRWR